MFHPAEGRRRSRRHDLGACLGACLAAALLASCAELPRAPAAAAPGFLAPRANFSGRQLTLGVLVAGWHSGLVLPARELGPLAPLLRARPGARYVSFGWGNRRFYMAAHPGSGDALAALFRSRSVLLVQPGPTAGALARESDATVHWLCVNRAQLWKVDVYLERSLALVAGRPVGLGAGALPGSTFYASSGDYDAFHTCNTWTLAALEYAGLPVSARGVVFADQVSARIAQLPRCARAHASRSAHPPLPPLTARAPAAARRSAADRCCRR